MAAKRKKHNPSFKSKVALEAIQGRKTSQEIARAYEIHPTQVAQWKRELLERAGEIFDTAGQQNALKEREAELSRAYEQIGRLNLELDWLKKKTSDGQE